MKPAIACHFWQRHKYWPAIFGRLHWQGFSSEEQINDIALRPDGKIVVVGMTFRKGTSTDTSVYRFLPDGSLDSSFDSSGIVVTDFNNTVDYAIGVELQPDGKILVSATTNVFDYSFGMLRYNQNGLLDKNI